MVKHSNDVIIIGAGIIGCSIAYRLAKEGLQVTVVERGRPGQEATYASAGMLTPQAEAAHGATGPFSDLCYVGLRLYPSFVSEIEEEVGIKLAFRREGSIFVATDYMEAEALAGMLERQETAGRPAEELSAQQAREMAPVLGEGIQSGLFLPEDCQVDQRQLLTALVQAASARGAQFLCSTPVIGLEVESGSAVGVRLPGRRLSGGIIINAAGCWAGLIDMADGPPLPVKPVRGQMLRVEQQPQRLRHLIYSADCYLVPWPDGRLLVGSTLENAGFNKEVTAYGVRYLLNGLSKIAPSLESAPIRETWAGLRPATTDSLPILGFSQIRNLVIATGHFRNGILLAPITAKLISELILTGQPSISLDPYSPDRFGDL